MRNFLILLFFLIPCSINAQKKMTAQEEELRSAGSYADFLNAVKNNNKENCLCRQNEYVIFSFNTLPGKTASLCISKTITSKSGYIMYRYGTKAKIELEYPADTLNSFSKFQFLMYSRGGGKANAGLELNNIEFTNNHFTYSLYDDYSAEGESYTRAIMITNDSTGKKITIDAKGTVTGHLSVFRDKNIVKFNPDEQAE